MAKKKKNSREWGDSKNPFSGSNNQGFQKKGTIGVRKGMR